MCAASSTATTCFSSRRKANLNWSSLSAIMKWICNRTIICRIIVYITCILCKRRRTSVRPHWNISFSAGLTWSVSGGCTFTPAPTHKRCIRHCSWLVQARLCCRRDPSSNSSGSTCWKGILTTRYNSNSTSVYRKIQMIKIAIMQRKIKISMQGCQ